jgi:hypothetical protein
MALQATSNLRSSVQQSGCRLEILLPRVLKHQLILLFFASTNLFPHAKRSHENTQKSSANNN